MNNKEDFVGGKKKKCEGLSGSKTLSKFNKNR